jgi:ABC-2 type transport system ATP-binding protein
MSAQGSTGLAIEAHGVWKRYGKVEALRGVDLEVRRGEIYGFLGRNGAGKTTMTRILLGLARADSGQVRILGGEPRQGQGSPLAKVGYLVESATAYPNLTVRENLEVHRLMVDAPRESIDLAIRRLNLGEYADRRASRLSLGNRQRLAIARALLNAPELLVLDEPANGLDPAGIVEMRELLQSLCRESGVTVFMSSHILSEVDLIADRVGIVHQGRILEVLERGVAERAARVALEVGADQAEAAALALRGKGIEVLAQRPAAGQLEERFMAITGGQA